MILVFYNSAMSTHYFYNKKLKITLKKSLSYLSPRVVINTNMKAELSNSKNYPKMEYPGRGFKHCPVTIRPLIRSDFQNLGFYSLLWNPSTFSMCLALLAGQSWVGLVPPFLPSTLRLSCAKHVLVCAMRSKASNQWPRKRDPLGDQS